MRNRSCACRAVAALLILAAPLLACGGDEQPAAVATVRPIGAPVEPHAAAAAAAKRESSEQGASTLGLNRAPRLKGVQIEPGGPITAGAEVRVLAEAVDPDGDEVEFLYTWWVNDERMDAEGPTFATGDLARGDTLRVQVIATDGSKEGSPMISPLLTIANGAPAIVSQPEWTVENGSFRYQVRAEDPEGDTDLRFSLARAPAGMKIAPLDGLIQWTPAREQLGKHPIEIVVEDSEGARGHQTFEMTLEPPDEQPPAALR